MEMELVSLAGAPEHAGRAVATAQIDLTSVARKVALQERFRVPVAPAHQNLADLFALQARTCAQRPAAPRPPRAPPRALPLSAPRALTRFARGGAWFSLCT